MLDLQGRDESRAGKQGVRRKRRVAELNLIKTRISYAIDARKSKVSEDAARTPHGDCVPLQHGGIWRIRIAGAGALLDGHQADRGRTRGHHTFHEAAREGLA